MRPSFTTRFIQSALLCGVLSGAASPLFAAPPGVVILQNKPLPAGSPVLPVNGAKVKKIIVAGPGAAGSLLAALQERGRKQGFQVVLEPWISSGFAPIAAGALTPDEKTPDVSGLKGEYFANLNLEGKPSGDRVDSELSLAADAKKPDPLVKLDGFSVRWTGFIKPTVPGKYRIRLQGEGKSRVWIKDQLVYDGWDKDPKKGGMGEFTNVPECKPGELCPVRIEYRNTGTLKIALSWMTFAKKEFSDLKAADLVILAVGPASSGQTPSGTSPETSENSREQDEFIAAAGCVNPVTVIVVQSPLPAQGRDGAPCRPSPVSTPQNPLPAVGNWAREHLPAILQASDAAEGEAVVEELFSGGSKKMLP